MESLIESPAFSQNPETQQYNNLDHLNRGAGWGPLTVHPASNLEYRAGPTHQAPRLLVLNCPAPTAFCSWHIHMLLILRPYEMPPFTPTCFQLPPYKYTFLLS